MLKDRPRASWLREVKSFLKDMGMAGLMSAWAMARQRTKEYRRKVDAAPRCFGVCPHTRPDLTDLMVIVTLKLIMLMVMMMMML